VRKAASGGPCRTQTTRTPSACAPRRRAGVAKGIRRGAWCSEHPRVGGGGPAVAVAILGRPGGQPPRRQCPGTLYRPVGSSAAARFATRRVRFLVGGGKGLSTRIGHRRFRRRVQR
jgi:hypothetical protein